MPVERLTIDDMSDREFLLVLHDQRDADGWTDSEQIAAASSIWPSAGSRAHD